MINNKNKYRAFYRWKYNKLLKEYKIARENPENIVNDYLNNLNSRINNILKEFPELKF